MVFGWVCVFVVSGPMASGPAWRSVQWHVTHLLQVWLLLPSVRDTEIYYEAQSRSKRFHRVLFPLSRMCNPGHRLLLRVVVGGGLVMSSVGLCRAGVRRATPRHKRAFRRRQNGVVSGATSLP